MYMWLQFSKQTATLDTMGYSIKDSPWFNFFYYTILFTYAYIQRNVCLHYTLLCTLTLLQLIINVVIPVPLSLVPSSDVDLPVKTCITTSLHLLLEVTVSHVCWCLVCVIYSYTDDYYYYSVVCNDYVCM